MEETMLSEIFMLRLEEEIRVRAVSLRNGNGFVAMAIELSGDRTEAERDAGTPTPSSPRATRPFDA
jgi:hypothetical protein